jgi:hypothetical protein
MKAFFLSRLFREKLILVAFIVLAAAMWLSSALGRASVFAQKVRATSTELRDQKQWLAGRAQIEAAAKNAVVQLDPSRTYDSVRLQSELVAIAQSVGLSKDTAIDDAQVSAGTQFSLNSVRFVIRNADWGTLERFYKELSKRSPYIGIEEFAIYSNKANPSQLNAALRVSSVEITH